MNQARDIAWIKSSKLEAALRPLRSLKVVVIKSYKE